MSSHRVLNYINTAIGVAVALALGAGYWYAYRPLPKTSGSVSAFVAQRVTIARDRQGVPHITAASVEDALFAQGYAAAQDRLWQMDGLRRFAAGELSEVVGPSALDSDREARTMRLRHLAGDTAGTLPAADRATLAAYARGVNAFIESHRGNLPLEFALLGYQPRPWTVADSLLLGFHMYRTLTNSWRDDLLKRNMLARGDAEKVNLLFPARTGAEVQPGSNAWAIAGSLTSSGKPILASDMHLEFSMPGVWYMAHLQAPGLNVSGVCLPGAPGIVVGHNERIAWGITNLHYDVQDLYIETIDARSGRYQFRGLPEQAQPERELILVKGGTPVELTVWITRHGPLLVSEGGVQMSLRWAAAEPGAYQFPFLDINRAANWEQFKTALARFPGPGSNFVYADVDGNIGYHAAGRMPIRKGFAGDVPVDGASGDFEWQGYIPFEELPFAFNPPSGMIVTSNQNPFPVDYPYAVNGNFASHYRSAQVRSLLGARKGWTPQQMLSVQTDIYSAFSDFLARSVVEAFDRRKAANPLLVEPVKMLRQWNGQMEKGLAAPFLATLIYQHVRKAVAERAAGGPTVYDLQMGPAVIEKLLRTRPAGWFSDWDQMLMRAFDDAVGEGRRIQGDKVAKWSYGRYTKITVAHPVGRQLPLVARYFSIGPVEMSGSSTTVKQTTHRLGPSMRMAADPGDWDRSLLNIVTGQSGQILSTHYKDQWDEYYAGRSFPMQFRKVDAPDVLELK